MQIWEEIGSGKNVLKGKSRLSTTRQGQFHQPFGAKAFVPCAYHLGQEMKICSEKYCSNFVQNFSTYTRFYTVMLLRQKVGEIEPRSLVAKI
jgi:hypothetical protein